MQSLILKVEDGLPAIFVVLQSHMTDNLIHQDPMVLPLVLDVHNPEVVGKNLPLQVQGLSVLQVHDWEEEQDQYVRLMLLQIWTYFKDAITETSKVHI